MAKHLSTGRQGENDAVEYLKQKGYQILHQNYRYKRAEIDIIAQKDTLLVFLEVKTRSNLSFGMPESFVNANKASLITKAADQYIFQQNWHGNIRFDIISVIITPQKTEIEHFEDAFY
jgi:putative endonuclease